MISGDWASVTLNHDTCGRILAEMPLRELSRLPSLQRSQVARFLVDRANRERPTLPTLDAADVQEDAQEAFRVASFGREER